MLRPYASMISLVTEALLSMFEFLVLVFALVKQQQAEAGSADPAVVAMMLLLVAVSAPVPWNSTALRAIALP